MTDEKSGIYKGIRWRAAVTGQSGYAGAILGRSHVYIRSYATTLERMERAARELIDNHRTTAVTAVCTPRAGRRDNKGHGDPRWT